MKFVVKNQKGQRAILKPKGGPPNHWIGFELEGTRSNRLALNARVRAIAGDLVQTGEVVSGGSYLSQPDLRIHFGLPNHDRVDRVEIAWPSVKKETLPNPPPYPLYKINKSHNSRSNSHTRANSAQYSG